MRRYLCNILFAFLAVFPVVLLQAAAKPDKPPPAKKSKYQYPDLNYPSNWGRMAIDRDSGEIGLEGHPAWTGDGQFVTPKKVYIIWYSVPSGRPAPGVYELADDNTLVGSWGWDDEVEVDQKAWTIKGKINGDKVYHVK